MRNKSILNGCTSVLNEMCYNFKKHDWFNNFTEENNETMKEGMVPWKDSTLFRVFKCIGILLFNTAQSNRLRRTTSNK